MDSWFRVGDVDVTTTLLVTALSALSLVVWAIDKAVLFKLALLPESTQTSDGFERGVRSGGVWRIVTWPLANIPIDTVLWTVVTIAIFWYFGSAIERMIGRNKMAIFLAYLTIVPGIVGTLLTTPQAGLEAVEFAVFLTFVLRDPFARFLFNIPAWALGLVLIAIQVIQLLGDRRERELIFLAVTLVVAALCARAMGLAEMTPWIPKLPIPLLAEPGTRRSTPRRPRAGRGGGGVVAGPWGETSRPASSLPQPPTGPPMRRPASASDQAELDALLDKIAAVGMNALSTTEKDRLNELSKRLRDG